MECICTSQCITDHCDIIMNATSFPQILRVHRETKKQETIMKVINTYNDGRRLRHYRKPTRETFDLTIGCRRDREGLPEVIFKMHSSKEQTVVGQVDVVKCSLKSH